MRDTTHPTALILGAAVWPDAQPSPTLRRRTDHAIGLYKAGVVTRIVASGGLGKHPPSEAEMMRRLCRAAGVPDAAIMPEERATNTLENIRFAAQLAPHAQFIIVTDLYHGPRAWLTARALGVRAQLSCPPMQGTKPLRVVKSWLREILALPFYAAKLLALRLSGRL